MDVGSGAVGYVPLGVTFFSRHGINLGMDIGPAFGRWVYMDRLTDSQGPPPDNNRNIYLYGNLKIGLRL